MVDDGNSLGIWEGDGEGDEGEGDENGDGGNRGGKEN